MPQTVANISLRENVLHEWWIQTAFCFVNFSYEQQSVYQIKDIGIRP